MGIDGRHGGIIVFVYVGSNGYLSRKKTGWQA
jgi:hypothetical protein